MGNTELYIYCTIIKPNISDIVKVRDFIKKSYDKSMPITSLYDMGICFYLRDKDDGITSEYSYNLNDRIVSRDSIDTLMFEVLYRDNNFEDLDVPKMILGTLSGFDLIIKLVDNNFYFIDDDDITKIGNDIINTISVVDEEKYVYINRPDYDSDGMKQFVGSFNSFIDTLETIIMNDACYVDITSVSGMDWSFDILKDGSDKYPSNVYPSVSSTSESGYRYMCGYEKLRDFIYSNVNSGDSLVVSIITFANLVEGSLVNLDMNDSVYKKIYCMVLNPIENRYFDMFMLTSEQVYNTCIESIPDMHPNYNFIYCGFKPNDVICGFDMVD